MALDNRVVLPDPTTEAAKMKMPPSWLSVLVLSMNFICGCFLFMSDYNFGILVAIASVPVFAVYHSFRMSTTRLWPSYLMMAFTGITSVLYLVLAGYYAYVAVKYQYDYSTLAAISAMLIGVFLAVILLLLHLQHRKFLKSLCASNGGSSRTAEVESNLLPNNAAAQPYTVVATPASESVPPNLVTSSGFAMPPSPYINRPVVLNAPEVPEVYPDSPPPSYATAMRETQTQSLGI